MNSTKLRGFLTGLILGDGRIDKGVTKRAFIIKSVNYDFIEYVDECLKTCTNFDISVREHDASFRDNVNRKSYKELTVKSHPYFNKKYNHFYDDNGKRRVTSEALSWLNAEGLANWFMSDGYVTLVGKNTGDGTIKDRRVELCTDRYPLHIVEKIKKYFEEVHEYKIKIVDRKRGNQYRLRISLMDAQNFFVMIAPHVVPSMMYKLNMAYVNRPKWMSDEYYQLMTEIMEREAPNT